MPLPEQQLITWSSPVSTSEDQKCKNAISQITDAIRKKFGNKVSIFLQGSYCNNTNVRLDSDVDIVVRYNEVYFPDLSFLSEEQVKTYHSCTTNATYTYAQFKNDVHVALQETFGANAKRQNKCIKVEGNTYRVNADVVACFVLKRFQDPYKTSAEGIKFFSDDGTEIVSFPEQHYNNGVSKTQATGRMYKRTVRILKNIRNRLIDGNIITDKLVSSFFIESLVWNVSNNQFIVGNYRQTLRNVIVVIYNDMSSSEKYNNYAEVSDLLWLFRGSKRRPEDAQLFMQKCWDYAGFE